jgi:folylpolyglutamate synthase
MLSTWTALARFDRGHGTYLPHQLSRRNDVDHDDIVNLVKDWQSIVQDYVFPGRQEWLSLEPITGRKEPVLLDGAHNVEGVEALSQVVQQLRRDRRSKPGPITWVIGISEAKDRNLEDILQPLLRPGDGVFAVEFGPVDGMPWVTPKTAEDIVQAARAVVPQIEPASSFASNVAGALQAASLHADGSHVVVCGSLYLAGEVHRLLRRHSEGDII